MDIPTSSLIMGAANVVGSLFNGYYNNRIVDKQIEAQSRENSLAFRRNMQAAHWQNLASINQWNRENEYNAPIRQRQRLSDAGLNPDLLYQNGASGLTAASSPSMASAPSYEPVDYGAYARKRSLVGDSILSGFEGALRGAQLDLLRAQVRKTDADAQGSEINNQTLGAMNDAELQRYRDTHKLNEQQFDNLKQTNDLIKEQVNLLSQQVQQARMTTKNMPLQLYQENIQRWWDIIWKKNDVARLLKDMELTDAEIYRIKETVPKQIELWNKELSELSLGSAIVNFLNGFLGEKGDTPLQTVTKLGQSLRTLVGNSGKPAPLVSSKSRESGLGRKLSYDKNGFVTYRNTYDSFFGRW